MYLNIHSIIFYLFILFMFGVERSLMRAWHLGRLSVAVGIVMKMVDMLS